MLPRRKDSLDGVLAAHRHQIAGLAYWLTGTEGSNPSLSGIQSSKLDRLRAKSPTFHFQRNRGVSIAIKRNLRRRPEHLSPLTHPGLRRRHRRCHLHRHLHAMTVAEQVEIDDLARPHHAHPLP